MMVDAIKPRLSLVRRQRVSLASTLVPSSPGLVVRDLTSGPILLPWDEEKYQHASNPLFQTSMIHI